MEALLQDLQKTRDAEAERVQRYRAQRDSEREANRLLQGEAQHPMCNSSRQGHEECNENLHHVGRRQCHLTEVLCCPGAGGGLLPAWRTELACEPLTAEHEKGDTDMKGWAEPEHLHAQPGSQTAWVGEVTP